MASKRKKDQKKAEEYLKKLEIVKSSNSVDPFESPETQQRRIRRAKSDVEYFVKTYLPHYTTVKSASFQIEFAEMVKSDPIFKGFAEWGRGLAKSVWCDVFIPLWLWINGETQYFVLISDSKERATDLLVDLQVEFEGNPLLIKDFGEQKTEGTWERGNFITQSGFIAKAFGVRQKVRGLRVGSRRPDTCSVDDLETPETIRNHKRMRQQAEWIERDLIPTMIGKYRRLLYANNRFARVMTQTLLQERHPHWTVHHVKAYNKVTYEATWSSMYSPEFYRQQEMDMGIVACYAEYNHETKLEGKNFSEDDIQWTKLPPLMEMKMIVVHWDIAYTDNETSDYNAVKAWGLKDRKFYLIDCYVKQSKMKLAVDWMCYFKSTLPHGVNVIFQYESQFWNGEVQRSIDDSETANDVSLNIMKVDLPHTQKLGRLLTMQPYFQNSRIFYNEELKSHSDTQVGIVQLCALEEGSTEKDDSPDADQRAIDTLNAYDTPSRRPSDGKTYKAGKMKHKYKCC